MIRMPLRRKILLSSSLLLLVLIVSMLVLVNYQAETLVNERIKSDLKHGIQDVANAENERLARLRATAQLVASFPELLALLGTDFATVRDFLVTYQQENPRAELLIVLDPIGQVIARTDSLIAMPLSDPEMRWMQAAQESQSSAGILLTERGPFHAVAVPAHAGGTVFGYVIAGERIDDRFARALAEKTQGEVILVGDHIVASTMLGAELPWRTYADWAAAMGDGAESRVLHVADRSYSAVSIRLGGSGQPNLLAVLLKSRDSALAPYRRIQLGLLALGLLVGAIGIAGSAALARTLTSSIADLVKATERVAAGHFDDPIDVESGDEIGELATSFNIMMLGLRERADMKKFVSHSTMEMIQAHLSKQYAAGERKTITVVFTDMRGFTSTTEKCPPEKAVQLLNSCLSLQADMVKHFNGDVDKFVGDCVMALFDGTDSTLRAIRCAVEIEQALAAQDSGGPCEPPIQVGIGIVTGEVILGSIGSEDRRDFTAVGPNVNLCSRLCSMAGPGEILLSESTYQEVENLVAAEPIAPLTLKGFSEPIPVYRISPRRRGAGLLRHEAS